MADNPHVHRVDLPTARMLLDELCISAARGHRVEILASDITDACVLVSKAEFDSLESAIELLSASPEFTRVDEVVHHVAEVIEASDASHAHPRFG